MSKRPENPNITWLKSIAEGSKGGLTPKFNAKCALGYITQLEAENAELKAAIEEWKKEETLRGGLALKNREEQDHE